MSYKLNEDGLTDKQAKFCEEYLIDLNATQAAIRSGYSEKTAYSIANENLRKPEILACLKKKLDKIQNETGITPKRVLEEYAKIAFYDIRKAYTVDGAIKDVREFDDETAGVVASLETYEELQYDDKEGERIKVGEVKKVKLHDKLRALEALGRHLGIFEKDNEQKVIAPPTINILPPNGN